MTTRELYDFLNKKIPPSLSCEWDNDGLMCCSKPDKEMRKVLVSLDISKRAVDRAIREGFDAIVSHHPLIFKPIKSLNTDTGVQRKLVRLVENGIAAMSFHTRLDALDGGVNDMLSHVLELSDAEAFGDEGEKMGRMGYTEETTLEKFAEKVKERLDTPAVLYSGGLPVKNVAVLGGNGDDFVFAAKEAGADTFVSGRIGYHLMAEAEEIGINLIEAGHFYTENPVLPILAHFIRKADSNIEIEFERESSIGIVK